MQEYTVAHTSLNCRWTFSRILPSLPVPGTSTFPVLCRELLPYGISASGIGLEAPTTFLSDVKLGISLLGGRVTLVLNYEWFELDVTDLYEGDETALVKIMEVLFTALQE